MKYIIFAKELGAGDKLVAMPVIFPDYIAHSQVKLIGGYKPISAGFMNAKGEPYGESESLGLNVHEDDKQLLWRALNGYSDGSWYIIDKRA